MSDYRAWPQASRIARARGLAQAIAECRDDARLDGIREGAAEIVQLLDLSPTAGAVSAVDILEVERAADLGAAALVKGGVVCDPVTGDALPALGHDQPLRVGVEKPAYVRTLLFLPRVRVPGKPHLRFSGSRWWVGEDIACRITYVWRAQGWADQRNPESLLDHMARVTAVLERKLP